MSFNHANAATSAMTSRSVVDSAMTRHGDLVEATSPYFTFAMINYTFDVTETRFTDDPYLANSQIPDSSFIDGHIYQGDLFWDDPEEDGMIDVSYHDVNFGFISSIYDPSHEVWGGCGYIWDASYPPMAEAKEIYRATLNFKFDDLSLPYTFDILDVYFGDMMNKKQHIHSRMLNEKQISDSSSTFVNYNINPSEWEPNA